jgi:hypothetical protein
VLGGVALEGALDGTGSVNVIMTLLVRLCMIGVEGMLAESATFITGLVLLAEWNRLWQTSQVALSVLHTLRLLLLLKY